MRRLSLKCLLGLVLTTGSMLLAGCSDDFGTGSEFEGVSAAPGISVNRALDDLEGPTQIAFDAQGKLLVAEINGGENDEAGRISRVSLDAGSAEVLFSGLDKPTGVASIDDVIWVMERDRLSSGSEGSGRLTAVLSDLPNNGRSEGTLTVLPEGVLLFNTSGSKRGADVVDGSGRIFRIGNGDSEPVEIAAGFKHAYARTVDAEGRLWATEMSDGRFDGDPAPDEIVEVAPNADHGWPHCVGDNRVVAEFGGTEQRCADVPRSLALFEPGASPTSVVVAPWDEDVLLVALWNRGQIVQVRTDAGLNATPDVLVSGLQNPQHLLVDGDSVLLSEFGAGRVVRIRRS